MTDHKTLHFGGHHSGALSTEVACGSNQTALSYLPAIFALARTRKPYDPEIVSEPFQTDGAGLKRLSELCGQAEDRLVDGMGAVGELLGRVDEPSEYSVNSVGWLLRGLADLYIEIKAVRGDAEYQAGRDGHA